MAWHLYEIADGNPTPLLHLGANELGLDAIRGAKAYLIGKARRAGGPEPRLRTTICTFSVRGQERRGYLVEGDDATQVAVIPSRKEAST